MQNIRRKQKKITWKLPTSEDSMLNIVGMHHKLDKVLLMDDDEDIRETALDILHVLGFDVTVASNGGETVEKYAAEIRQSGQPFDAVIMDISARNGMDGSKCIQALRKIDPNVKAVITSGHLYDPLVKNYKEYGFRGFVPKPYELEALSRVLVELIH